MSWWFTSNAPTPVRVEGENDRRYTVFCCSTPPSDKYKAMPVAHGSGGAAVQADLHAFGYASGSLNPSPLWVNLQPLSGIPALVAMFTADSAVNAASLSDTDLQGLAVGQVHAMFGANASTPKAFLRTRWGTDPYSLGAYSYPTPSPVYAAIAALAAPVCGRLFFAGEATDPLCIRTRTARISQGSAQRTRSRRAAPQNVRASARRLSAHACLSLPKNSATSPRPTSRSSGWAIPPSTRGSEPMRSPPSRR
jgi:hypothetical protein